MNPEPNKPKPQPMPLEYRNPDISREEAKRGRHVYAWIAGIAGVFTIFVAVAAILPAPNRHYRVTRMVKDAANLKNIGLACEIYANNYNGRFPASFEEMILTTDLTPDIFINPRSADTASPGTTKAQQAANLSTGGHCSYVYVGKGLTDKIANPADVAVAYDRAIAPQSGGINILYANCHVQWQPGSSVAAILAAATKPPIFPPTTNPATTP